jgi:spermidine/putrescine transport system ATP-binding protein/putrescine transport system ATP-binding protein
MSDDSYISIQNVQKYFGSFCAIENISMDIAHGEFFSLLGASGCGKTTLLRMLAGFESPTKGEIFIDNQPMADVPPHYRPVNMVFQSYAIFPHLNVHDNIAYGLRKRKLPKAKVNEMVDEMLNLISLPGYGNRKANELSGGQRQRIALARALILKPKVLLLDEPLGALDKQLREQMQLELRQLQRTVGITFVFVTHDQEEAMTLSDRIAVMADGEVMQLDSPIGLYERPVNRKVASFIGTMNFFDGVVADGAGDTLKIDAQGLGPITAPTNPSNKAGFYKGDKVQVAIRPEKLLLSAQKPDAAFAASGRVQNMAYLGERSHYLIEMDGLDKHVAVSSQNLVPGANLFEMGSDVWINWQSDAVVVLERN